MREFRKIGKWGTKRTKPWISMMILLGLLGFTQIQCSEAPSQTPSATSSPAILETARPATSNRSGLRCPSCRECLYPASGIE